MLGDRADHRFASTALERSATPEDAVVAIARGIALHVTEDTQRGRLALEFAAHATRHGPTAAAVTRTRRAQRETVTALVTELTERHGVRFTAGPETVALTLHCLTNGLSMEHLADPEAVDARAVEDTLITALAGFTARPRHEETP
ncbi:TetR family transcriptional regulator C-terminal domain-containing protein [Nocardiopsis eucommiae]|uniref:TetR family transcriptional regulator C-terminal domain-containing protein n=1 Tax=Nocardiopsis eucommiae TaxID=2831970 RepID=A0A975LBJ9_9ACTN|nr:TetR family transcriptional regulator C-terminal domain-containing protein [Nocardiopsis eucommiae]